MEPIRSPGGAHAAAILPLLVTRVNLFVAIKSQFPVQRNVGSAICYKLVVHSGWDRGSLLYSHGSAALKEVDEFVICCTELPFTDLTTKQE